MNKITCPNCGAEYLPVEIFIPEAFFGTVKAIEKDPNGKIVDVMGSKMSLKETYKCDYCDAALNVKALLKFDVNCKAANFSSEYVTKLNKPHLFMSEK